MRWTQWVGIVTLAALLWNAGHLGELWGLINSRGDLIIVTGMTVMFVVLLGATLYLAANP